MPIEPVEPRIAILRLLIFAYKQAVDVYGGVAGEDSREVLGVEFPAGQRALEGVDFDGVVNRLAAEVRIGITGYGGAQGSKGYEGVKTSQHHHEGGDSGEYHAQAGKAQRAHLPMGGVLGDGEPLYLVEFVFTHIIRTFAFRGQDNRN